MQNKFKKTLIRSCAKIVFGQDAKSMQADCVHNRLPRSAQLILRVEQSAAESPGSAERGRLRCCNCCRAYESYYSAFCAIIQ